MPKLRQVGDVDETFAPDQRLARRRLEAPETLAEPGGELLVMTALSDRKEMVSITQVHRALHRAAEDVRLLQYRFENRGEVAGRRIDDPQHLGGRGLLFQSLSRLGDQSRVLDGDDRLIGKGLDEFNLSLGEGFDMLSKERKHADHRSLSQKRYAQISTYFSN